VLVVQSNPFNESRIQTVVIAAISSDLRLADAPGNLRLRPAESGLPKPSVVDVSQLLTVRRDYLRERAAALPARAMHRVAEGLRLVLGL
jgi:mRNA interferase MazF